jgi:hypothetical protein
VANSGGELRTNISVLLKFRSEFRESTLLLANSRAQFRKNISLVARLRPKFRNSISLLADFQQPLQINTVPLWKITFTSADTGNLPNISPFENKFSTIT